MGLYSTKGLYKGYDKNHKERDKTDYYATPPKEVLNILNTLNLDFSNSMILEPCCGGGHMILGIEEYLNNKQYSAEIIGTDLHAHGCKLNNTYTGEGYDFLSDNYGEAISDKLEKVDWIIMNPPYSTIEPFTIRALEIANKGVIMLARLQFVEGQKRYENILKTQPFSDIYVYVDRIQCWKSGEKPDGSSAQAYCWIVWNKEENNIEPKMHWIRRAK